MGEMEMAGLPASDKVRAACGAADEMLTSLVAGRPHRSLSEASIELRNPSTAARLLILPEGGAGDVDAGVDAARSALAETRWDESAPAVRQRILARWADLIARDAKMLDRFDAEEMGKPVGIGLFNAAAAADLAQFYASAVGKSVGEVYGSDGGSLVCQRRVARGVVAAIVPWNFPTYNAVLKVAPALAAGNAVVLKPSELTPRSAIRLGELALEAGLPPGILNVILGIGETVGRDLALHHDVDMLTFTGSTAVGKRLLEYAGQSNMKVVTAECGGKSPQIVFNDGVDLDAAADAIAGFLLTNQGQICSVGSRLLVQRSIHAELVGLIDARLRNRVIGDALDPATTFGPIASAKQFAHVFDYIKAGQAEGATLVAGGRRANQNSDGYFIEPTLFDNVSPTARIAREEIFGPVLSVMPFDDEEAAVRIANGTIYGLLAYVWTTDVSRAMRMARAIRSSVVINAGRSGAQGPGHMPSYEPYGQSGVGVEGGLAGMESYLRRQLVWINHA